MQQSKSDKCDSQRLVQNSRWSEGGTPRTSERARTHTRMRSRFSLGQCDIRVLASNMAVVAIAAIAGVAVTATTARRRRCCCQGRSPYRFIRIDLNRTQSRWSMRTGPSVECSKATSISLVAVAMMRMTAASSFRPITHALGSNHHPAAVFRMCCPRACIGSTAWHLLRCSQIGGCCC